MLLLNLPDGALSELMYVDNLVLMSETTDLLKSRFLKWKEAFVSKGLKDNLVETKVMVRSGITHDGLSKSNVDPCEVSLRLMVDTVLCVVW